MAFARGDPDPRQRPSEERPAAAPGRALRHAAHARHTLRAASGRAKRAGETGTIHLLSKLPGFVSQYFSAYDGQPLAAPIELAQHLVFGAVEYARNLGFEPHADFEACEGHLGSWTGPSAISFGCDGKPLFIQGPYDNAARIMSALQRSVGQDNFHFTVSA